MNPHRVRLRCLLASLLLLAGSKSGTAEQLFLARDRTILTYETTIDTAFGQIEGELYETDLKTANSRRLRTSGIWIPSLAVAPPPEIPVSGLYRIDSGRFQVCCGLLGPMEFPLPNAEQQYIALSITPDGGTASMTVLAEDQKTVFALEGGGLRDDFVYQFQNGIMSLHSLVFNSPPALDLHKSSYAYALHFTDTGLSLQGSVRIPCVFCADFPEDFSHLDVTATLVTSAPLIESFRRSDDTVRFTFKGEPGYDYFVEYAKTLPAIEWKVLTQFRSKLFPIEPEVIDTIGDESMRAYRIRKQPCQCR